MSGDLAAHSAAFIFSFALNTTIFKVMAIVLGAFSSVDSWGTMLQVERSRVREPKNE
jgi:hypothetical protein